MLQQIQLAEEPIMKKHLGLIIAFLIRTH